MQGGQQFERCLQNLMDTLPKSENEYSPQNLPKLPLGNDQIVLFDNDNLRIFKIFPELYRVDFQLQSILTIFFARVQKHDRLTLR